MVEPNALIVRAEIRIVGIQPPIHRWVPVENQHPAVEAIVRRRIGPIALRQIAPRGPGAEDEKDRVQHPPIVLASGDLLDDRPPQAAKVR